MVMMIRKWLNMLFVILHLLAQMQAVETGVHRLCICGFTLKCIGGKQTVHLSVDTSKDYMHVF